MQIRTASNSDYAAIAALASVVSPDRPVTAEILAHYDAQREPHHVFGRWLAEVLGQVVGVASYIQHADIYVPGEVHVNVRVHPGHRNRGIGAALYEAMVDRLRRTPPVDTLKVTLDSDQHAGINFAVRRGFVEYARRIDQRLTLASFDPAAFPDPDAQMAEQGLALRSVRELETDPDRDRKLYDLKWEVEQDIPYPGEINRPSFEAFRDGFINAPDFIPDGAFVAVDGDRYVGLVFHVAASPALLAVEVTGTARDYRRRGVALALKLKGIAWAKQGGYATMMVNNDLANVGMLAINEKLGFVRRPALIMFRRGAPF
jgi:mycothiol synthase